MRALPAAALIAALAGCAGPPVLESRWPPDQPRSIELEAVPFHPQDEFQCGPAALATILGASGRATSASSLVDEVYVPGRRGSLQPEIVAAARRRGLLVYPVRPELTDLVAQLGAGEPVLVLQNLGIERLPVWHYAVVIGADAGSESILLRSGTERRRVERARDFLRRWDLAGRWGIVVLAPGQLPANPDWPAYLRAAADLEAAGHPAAAAAAYAAALERRPELAAARFGLANVRYDEGDLEAAARLYESLAKDPDFGVPALNNLANLYADEDCPAAARFALDLAAARAAAAGDFAAALADTRSRLTKTPPREGDPPGCPAPPN
jgi:tetratricopeptide (TPR) repeat protein